MLGVLERKAMVKVAEAKMRGVPSNRACGA